MFNIDVLPARHGDCIWIEYGSARETFRILIDGGPGFAYPALRRKIETLGADARRIDLLIVTHIDADHIEGVIRLLRDTALGVRIGEIWYNAWPQLAAPQTGLAAANQSFGALQGEFLSALIKSRKIPWNRIFGGGPAVAPASGEQIGALPLPGGASVTLLSPTRGGLARLRDAWEEELLAAGLEPDSAEEAMKRLEAAKRLAPPRSFGLELPDVEELAAEPFECDRAIANGSSIALLLEYEGARCLMLGDAHPDVVEGSLRRLATQRGASRVAVDLVKIPHHGSRSNLSPGLLDTVESPRFVISTDGSYFNHPDPEALARLVLARPEAEIVFNYRSQRNAIWDDPRLKARYGYRTVYPAAAGGGVPVVIQD